MLDIIVDLSESTGQQQLQVLGGKRCRTPRCLLALAGCVNAGEEGPEHLADGCHGILVDW